MDSEKCVRCKQDEPVDDNGLCGHCRVVVLRGLPPAPRPTSDACIRCRDAGPVGEDGYCSHCHWVVRVELEEGIDRFSRYLEKQARFSQWLDANA
jgi:ferredoxin